MTAPASTEPARSPLAAPVASPVTAPAAARMAAPVVALCLALSTLLATVSACSSGAGSSGLAPDGGVIQPVFDAAGAGGGGGSDAWAGHDGLDGVGHGDGTTGDDGAANDDPHARLCEPCMADEACQSPAAPDATCVDLGASGAFCGTPCAGDLDCPAGHGCRNVPSVTGSLAMRCVPLDGTDLGVCGCSPRAVALGLTTSCRAASVGPRGEDALCPGTRTCTKEGPAGLGPCQAPAPSLEACDGLDNDCDGETDETVCDDGDPCTEDACDAEDGCATSPVADGTACDDGEDCTLGEACTAGSCVAPAGPLCDDDNICTVDACTPELGCVYDSFSNDGVSCDDGDPCTGPGLCSNGFCLAGAGQGGGCDDGDPCTVDTCGEAGCTSSPAADGQACDDGDPCTAIGTCTDGECEAEPLVCADNEVCTTDSCVSEGGVGCVFAPVADGTPCPGGGTCGGGACVVAPSCGDGLVNQPTEICDDGNQVPMDGCSPTCKVQIGPGQLLISEALRNPKGTGTDDTGEWFEVVNAAQVPLVINGLAFHDNFEGKTVQFTPGQTVTLAPGEAWVFVANGDAFDNGGITGGWPYGYNNGPQFKNSAGEELWLKNPDGSVIDSYIFDQSATDGVAWQRDPASFAAAASGGPASWCLAKQPYGNAGNLGTPGSMNTSCP